MSTGENLLTRLRRRSGPAILLIALSVTVCGCSGFTLTLNDKVEQEVAGHSRASSLEVDFSRLVDGKWDRIVLICGAIPEERIDQELGFDWSLPKSENPYGNSIMLFANSQSVVSRYIAGLDDQDEDEYFNPCFGTGVGKSAVKGPVEEIISVARDRSRIELTSDKVDSDFTMWYISEAERKRLSDGT